MNLLSKVLVTLFAIGSMNPLPVQAAISTKEPPQPKSSLISDGWWSPKHANPCSNWYNCGIFVWGVAQPVLTQPCSGFGDQTGCTQDQPPTRGNQNGDNSENCDNEGRCTSRANSRRQF